VEPRADGAGYCTLAQSSVDAHLQAHSIPVCRARVARSIVSPGVRIDFHSRVADSILFGRVQAGRHAKIRRGISDKEPKTPPGFSIGYDLEKDARRFTVAESGVAVRQKEH
jgi:glucose-1-phosphate adenylyltransferase